MQSAISPEPDVVVGPEPLAPRVVAVEAVGPTLLRVSFESGDVRLFDVAPLLDRGVFRQLADPGAFANVAVVEGGGGVAWEAGPDLSANRLYFSPRVAE